MTNDPGQEKVRRALEFVQLGYGDILDENAPFRALHFRTDRLSTSEVQQIIRAVKEYNAFSGAKVASALDRFKGRISSYEFGRDGSPVLYIQLPYATNQIEEAPNPHVVGSRISDAEHSALLNEMKKVFLGGLAANEFEAVDDHQHEMRAWWG